MTRPAGAALTAPGTDAPQRQHLPLTAPVADALVRLGRLPRVAPSAIHRLLPGPAVAAPAIPCRHSGSVDVFLEAIHSAEPGSILVIDNAGRLNEACIGDLVVAEAQAAGIAAMVVDGLHRDSVELHRLGMPLWSRGSIPVGPLGTRAAPADRLRRARIGDIVVTPDDLVVADDDGVLFLAAADADEVFAIATEITAVERRQTDAIVEGRSLWAQLGFETYLARRAADPAYDLRRHLREMGGAIET